jgi:hypothetical protein
MSDRKASALVPICVGLFITGSVLLFSGLSGVIHKSKNASAQQETVFREKEIPENIVFNKVSELVESPPNLSSDEKISLLASPKRHRDKKVASRQLASESAFSVRQLPGTSVVASVRQTTSLTVDHFFTFDGGYGLTTVDSKDQSGYGAKLSSKTDLNLNFGLSQNWNKKIKTFQTLHFRQIEFLASQNPNRPSPTDKKNLLGLSVGLEKSLTSRTHARIFGSYKPEIFVSGGSNTTISANAINTFSYGAKLSYDFFQADSTLSSVFLEGERLQGASGDSISSNAGFRYTGGLQIKKYWDDREYAVQFGYRRREQNTKLTNQSEDSVFAGISFGTSLFSPRGDK